MYYLGIDIGKNNHEAGFIQDDGSHVGKSVRFSNSREGFERLIHLIEERLARRHATANALTTAMAKFVAAGFDWSGLVRESLKEEK